MQNWIKSLLAFSLFSSPAFADSKDSDELNASLLTDIRSVILQQEHILNPDFLKVTGYRCELSNDESQAYCSGNYRCYHVDPFFEENAKIADGQFTILFSMEDGKAVSVLGKKMESQEKN